MVHAPASFDSAYMLMLRLTVWVWYGSVLDQMNHAFHQLLLR